MPSCDQVSGSNPGVCNNLGGLLQSLWTPGTLAYMMVHNTMGVCYNQQFLGEATNRPGKPVKISSLWYLEGSVPKGGILSYTIAVVGEYVTNCCLYSAHKLCQITWHSGLLAQLEQHIIVGICCLSQCGVLCQIIH